MYRSASSSQAAGDGGDELFAGYRRYRAMQLAEMFDRIPIRVRRGA